MSTFRDGSNAIKSFFSSNRIMFSLLPGLGSLIVFRMAIHLYRPDIEDALNRVRPTDNLSDCYDFIIVGGGSAGSVLANRLSENPEWTVLLLEAGQDENVLSEVPSMFPVLQTSAIDWQFVTEPSDGYCLSMIDRRCKWPRGKVLGGSSVLNAMLYIRGNKKDYDIWASLGNPGWSYEDVLPYFLKSENMRVPGYQNDRYHSTGGPLTVEYFRYQQPITDVILEAGRQLGYPVHDVNGAYQAGFTRSHATVREGLRCSTAKAFLRPAAKRSNLHVSVYRLAEKVLIDENKRAYGVKVTKHGSSRIIKASREVILSAGAMQSPQLLMLSGIGDAEHLKELGIHPIVHLPGVGKNLQDHVAMGGHSFLFDNPYDNGTDFCFNILSALSVSSLIDFAMYKKGPLYSMMEAEAMAFVNTKYQDPSEDYPDVQMFIAPTADNLDGGLFGKRANGLTDESYAALYEDIILEPSFSIVPLLLRPKSRGYLKLRDANPYSPPLIYPNYFSDPYGQDIKVLIEGARIVQELVNQPALQALKARPNPSRNPGCERHELMSDEHLECQARHHSLTIYHPVGTCAMGPVGDQFAVVDARLRVYGIRNLRVVDGSIMPNIVSGNTNAPVIMIAEKASDMIKEDWSDYQPSVCPEYTQYKSSENDEAHSGKQIKSDFFSETVGLFPHLPTDANHNLNLDKTNSLDLDENTFVKNNKDVKAPEVKVTPYINAVNKIPKAKIPKKNPFMKSVVKPKINSDLLKPYAKNVLPAKPLPYLQNNYVVPKIPSWQDTLNKLRNRNRLVNSNIFGQTYQSPLIDMLNGNYDYDNYDEPYYETEEVITPNGEKSCRIWLTYDGKKYLYY